VLVQFWSDSEACDSCVILAALADLPVGSTFAALKGPTLKSWAHNPETARNPETHQKLVHSLYKIVSEQH
jgi:hypothetical protein